MGSAFQKVMDISLTIFFSREGFRKRQNIATNLLKKKKKSYTANSRSNKEISLARNIKFGNKIMESPFS